MTDMDNAHANNSNPCQGICAIDDNGYCLGCFRTNDERSNWYTETVEWRENVLEEIKKREEAIFGEGK
jgi:predicted Fe-S protein YdhL (DUF1289 family)